MTTPAPPSLAAQPLAERDLANPVFQAFTLLRVFFTVGPIVFGLDKFTDWLVDWPTYLAGPIDDLIPGSGHQLIAAVGIIEVVAGITVAIRPRFGAYLITFWLMLIILNLVIVNRFYDVALRDLGLLIATLALGQLAKVFPPRGELA